MSKTKGKRRAFLGHRKWRYKRYPAAWAATARHIGMRVVTNGMVRRRRVPPGAPRPVNLEGDVPQDVEVLLQGGARRMGILDADTGDVVVKRAFLPSDPASAVTRLVASRLGGDYCSLARWLRDIHAPLPRLNRDSVALPEQPGETVLIGPQSNRFNATHYGVRVLPSKAFLELRGRNGGADLRLYIELIAAIEEDTLALVGAKDLAANKRAVRQLGDAHCLGKKLVLFGQTEIVVNAGFEPHRDKDCAKGTFTSVLAVYEEHGTVYGGSQTFPERGVVMTMPNGTLASGRYGDDLHAVSAAATPEQSPRVAVVCFINRTTVEGVVKDRKGK